MDPSLFGLNADVVGQALGAIVLLSLIVERALAPVFEWRPVLDNIKGKDLKEPIAIAVSVAAVWYVKFDALAVIFSQESNSWIGYGVTGLVVAGGSKGSIKLFREYMGWKSSARKEYEETKAQASTIASQSTGR